MFSPPPPPSTSPLFNQTLAAYLVITRALRKTLSFKGLAIISVEHNKMASSQEEGEVSAVVRRCMSHRLALEVGSRGGGLVGGVVFFFLNLLFVLFLVRRTR